MKKLLALLSKIVARFPFLSKYQKAVAEWVIQGSGNAAVNAVAGSGKTWTLVNVIAPLVGIDAVFCAFGKAIAQELGKQLPKNFESRTINSLAFQALKKRFPQAQLNQSKYYKLVKEYCEDLPSCPSHVEAALEGQEGKDFFGSLLKLTNFVRSTLTNPTNFDAVRDIALHYEVELPWDQDVEEYLLQSLARILSVGRNTARHEFDHNDCIWLTALEKEIQPKKFFWILVDEAQDLNAGQLSVLCKALKKGGRMLFVGDPRQAIMGFAGADNRSFQNIVDKLNCTELPLSVCYRCPTSHLELAREIVPHIEAAPDAIEGKVERKRFEDINFVEGDMILCRVNSELISLCFKLIAEGKPARIKGKKIGESLVSTAKKISSRRDFQGWDEFGYAVDSWRHKEIEKVLKRNGGNDDDPRIETLSERAQCLTVIWANSEAATLREFKKAVEDIFSDGKPGITLSSVHRAKGLQADNVFILRNDLLPGPWAKEGTWQYEQEMNLRYVALTRSKENLTFIM